MAVAEKAAAVNMPYVTERWPGGMLTNFPTIRKAVKKMTNIDKLTADGTFSNLSKREILQISRQRAKLEKNLGSIADLTRLPAALFVVDVCKEHIAVKEAIRLGIPVFGIVDTNADPNIVDFAIPANDDATKSIEVILDACCAAIAEGVAATFDMDVEIELKQGGYLPVENNPELARELMTFFDEKEDIELIDIEPAMTGEDFGYLLSKVPGVMFWLGIDSPYALHHPKMSPKEEALAIGVDAVSNFLAKKAAE